MDREAWHAEVLGVTKSQTGQSNWTELNWKENPVICDNINESWGHYAKVIDKYCIVSVICGIDKNKPNS